MVYWVYPSCMVNFMGCETLINLIILDVVDFDVIFVMDWLTFYYAILD